MSGHGDVDDEDGSGSVGKDGSGTGRGTRAPHMLSWCSATIPRLQIQWVIISQQRAQPPTGHWPDGILVPPASPCLRMRQETKFYPGTLRWADCGGICAYKRGSSPRPPNYREFSETVRQKDLPGKITIRRSEAFNAGSRLEGGGCTVGSSLRRLGPNTLLRVDPRAPLSGGSPLSRHACASAARAHCPAAICTHVLYALALNASYHFRTPWHV